MTGIRRPVDGPAGVAGPQPDKATPSGPPGPQPAAQAPFGLTRQSAYKRPAGGMAPRNGQLPGVRLQPGDAVRQPPDPLPQARQPLRQEPAQARPASPPAPTTARPQVPPPSGQAAPTPDPVKTNQVLGSGLVKVGLPSAGVPQLQAQQHTLNVPAGRLPAHVGRLYRELNLKVTQDTLPAYTNGDLLARPTELGSGAFNTLFAVELKKPDGTRLDGVFKPLGKVEDGWVAKEIGIPPNDPQIAMRNIATLAYAQKLGIDVIPDTRVAVLDTGSGQAEGPKLGLVMERARGKPAAEADTALFNRADVCAEVTKLQLLDHLTGQGGRRHDNYFIDIGPDGKAKVTGIDNDLCFGSRLSKPNGVRYANNDTLYGFHGTALPPVVDTEMADMIHALTPDDLREMLGNKLSEAEVQAAIARHEGVKEHINVLARQGRIIPPSDWGRPAITKLLTADNSYVGREREYAPLVRTPSPSQAGPAGLPRQPNAGW
jgi:hypothetical protein